MRKASEQNRIFWLYLAETETSVGHSWEIYAVHFNTLLYNTVLLSLSREVAGSIPLMYFCVVTIIVSRI